MSSPTYKAPVPPMTHAVTSEIVKEIFAEESAAVLYPENGPSEGVKKTRLEVFQGTRTRVHLLLQEQVPCPYVLPPPETRSDGKTPLMGPMRTASVERRKAALIASIPDELILESEKARAQLPPSDMHRDAVHYAQKQYGKALWAETDRLVSAAMGGLS